MKILTPILAFYFLLLFPAVHLAFLGNPFIYEFWHIFYYALTLMLVLALKCVTPQQLGLNITGKALLTGALLGILPIIRVPLLDGLLVKAGWAQSELFTGADLRVPEEMGFNKSLPGLFFTTLLIPFLDQVFVVGLVINNLLKKQNTGQVILGGGLLFSLIHFELSMGNLLLGMVSAGLLRATGSIIAPVLVHACFSIAEVLIVFHYPRLISVLVFLV
ncbi:MAG: hypothetical protein COW89_03385 [Nitrospinae bacterium CG22_combo_CG10-13_8_21_14_all_47_10]|nr:MAG: hypothetical protein COW89_03385 [Nitrospinae bacterium CG22_combo_CG10-13_8_21_14_all_47_10]